MSFLFFHFFFIAFKSIWIARTKNGRKIRMATAPGPPVVQKPAPLVPQLRPIPTPTVGPGRTTHSVNYSAPNSQLSESDQSYRLSMKPVPPPKPSFIASSSRLPLREQKSDSLTDTPEPPTFSSRPPPPRPNLNPLHASVAGPIRLQSDQTAPPVLSPRATLATPLRPPPVR